MLARVRKSMEEKDQGFTLIELLVVMIIIGILAAIAIPVFLNQQKKARETSAKNDVTTIGKEITAYYIDGDKQLAVAGATAGGAWTLTESGVTTPAATGQLSKGNTVGANSKGTGPTDWCVSVTTSDTTTWSYRATTTATNNGLNKTACP